MSNMVGKPIGGNPAPARAAPRNSTGTGDLNIRPLYAERGPDTVGAPRLIGPGEGLSRKTPRMAIAATMDLAAAVCHPRQPACVACPVEAWCSGPNGYVPPPPQSRFEGSARQLRGCIVRAVVRQPLSFDQIRRETGFPTEEIEIAIEDLEAEGLIRRDGDRRWQIGD